MSLVQELDALEQQVTRLATAVLELNDEVRGLRAQLAELALTRTALEKVSLQLAETRGEITGRFAVVQAPRQDDQPPEISASAEGLRIGRRRLPWALVTSSARGALVIVSALVASALALLALIERWIGGHPPPPPSTP